MQFTIEITDAAKLTGLQRAAATYNTLNPATTKTDAEFLQWTIENQMSEYARALTKPVITKLEFLERFTAEERVAIRTAAQSSIAIQDYLELVNVCDSIDLTYGTTKAGVQALENAGLIAPGRSVEILAL
jgi:hypothetical protein